MRFQLVISLLVSLSTLGTLALAKERKVPVQEYKHVQCQFVDLLSGDEDYQWALLPSGTFVTVKGTKNSDNQFVTLQNEQLLRDYCTYTKRAHYGEEKSAFYEEAGMLASRSSFSNSMPLVFDSETAYPANVDPEWAKNLKPGKVKPKRNYKLLATKAAVTTAALAILGIGRFIYGPEFFGKIRKATSITFGTIAFADFIVDEAAGADKFSKAIEKVEKVGEKFETKKPDELKDLEKQWYKRELGIPENIEESDNKEKASKCS